MIKLEKYDDIIEKIYYKFILIFFAKDFSNNEYLNEIRQEKENNEEITCVDIERYLDMKLKKYFLSYNIKNFAELLLTKKRLDKKMIINKKNYSFIINYKDYPIFKIRVNKTKKENEIAIIDEIIKKLYQKIGKYQKIDISSAQIFNKEVMKIFSVSEMEIISELINNNNEIRIKNILQDNIKHRICPYCNRSYTFILKNNQADIEFDHLLPKKVYKRYSVSLYNLIPTCKTCNQIKSQNIILRKSYFDTTKFKFKLVSDIEMNDNFIEIRNINNIDELYAKLKNKKIKVRLFTSEGVVDHEPLFLTELYNFHSQEIKIFLKKYKIYFNKGQIKIMNKFVNKKRLVEFLFDIPYERSEDEINRFYSKNILSKFRHDIFNQLEGEE